MLARHKPLVLVIELNQKQGLLLDYNIQFYMYSCCSIFLAYKELEYRKSTVAVLPFHSLPYICLYYSWESVGRDVIHQRPRSG